MTAVKICGIREYEDALRAVELGAFALGFNFYPKSPRAILPERAGEIIAKLPNDIRMVGVFVNATRAEVEEVATRSGINSLQFHGDETPEFCRDWHNFLVIRALRLGRANKKELPENYLSVADFLLLDQFSPDSYGGTGKNIDADELEVFLRERTMEKVFLAGGINPLNAEARIRAYHPYGIDVASGVEISPGKKDPKLLEALFAAVGRADLP